VRADVTTLASTCRRGGIAASAAAALAALAVAVKTPTNVAAEAPTREATLSPAGLLGLDLGSSAARRARTAANGPDSLSSAFVLDQGRFTRFDPPGPTPQDVTRINDRGEIVGGVRDIRTDTGFRGYLRDNRGSYRAINVPGAASTQPNDINDEGQIVGTYSDTSPSTGAADDKRGFLRSKRGRFRTIHVPGAVQSQAYGINDRGQVVGEYYTDDGTIHGYVWEEGRFTTLDGPLGAGASALDINDRGQVVGLYLDGDPTDPESLDGFLLSGGAYTTFDAPGTGFTFPFGLNNQGQIVVASTTGGLRDVRSYVLRKGVGGPFSQIKFPGSIGTLATGINAGGQIVGIYFRSPFSVTPKRRVVNQGESATFTATIKNPSGADLRAAKVCVRTPSRAIRVGRCVNLGTLPGGVTRVRFEAEASRNAKPRSYKLTFKASATQDLERLTDTATATLRVREQGDAA
jgi:probable HAF family extracellular repeat protein